MTDDDIAMRFVSARRQARALPGYPGDVPARLGDAYAIQDQAIDLYGQPIAGWKIARVRPDRQAELGAVRLCGPVFAATLKHTAGEIVTVPVHDGGFAAVEAEFVFRVDHDADPAKTEYSEEEGLRLIDRMFAGVEMAGSPLATLNALGPTAVASDFGNNFGLVIGEALAEFDSDATPATLGADVVVAWLSSTEIDGAVVGDGGLSAVPGGPLAAIAWLAGALAQRGRPLRRGQYISSGATTGVHDIKAGGTSVVRFTAPDGGQTSIALRTVRLEPGAPELG